jgi:hypothetical protein
MPEPIFPGIYKPPVLAPRSVMRRIRRHAHELARRAFVVNYQRYTWAMLEQLEAGSLDRQRIELWEPNAWEK